MEFRKMVMITLYVRQQKRHRCIKQSFGLCGRGWGWDDLGERHCNMYIIICEMNRQSRFDAWYMVLGAGAMGWPRGMVWEGRWVGCSGWGTHVHPWQIHVNTCTPMADSCQCMAKPIQYCKVKKKKKKDGKNSSYSLLASSCLVWWKLLVFRNFECWNDR